MVTAGATANTTVKNSRASRESGLLCSHSHGEFIDRYTDRIEANRRHFTPVCMYMYMYIYIRLTVRLCVGVRWLQRVTMRYVEEV